MRSMTKSRIFLWGLLSFLAGVLARSFFVFPTALIFWGVLLVFSGWIAGLCIKQRSISLACFFLLLFFVGVLRFDRAEALLPDLSPFDGKEIAVRGVIAQDPEQLFQAQRFLLEGDIKIQETKNQRVAVLVTSRKYPEYVLGDEVVARGVFEKSFRKDISGQMPFPSIERISEGNVSFWREMLSRLKRAFEGRIESVLPEPHASLLKGLLLGVRESLPGSLLEDLKRTGTTHIIALSGYNITIVGEFVLLLLLFFTVPFRISFWIASAFIVFFVIMTGASPSVVRAGIMGILVLVARRSGRVYYLTNALACAAAVMVFVHPFLLRFDVAFELSFLATVGLAYGSPIIDRWMGTFNVFRARSISGSDHSGAFAALKRILAETLAAQLAVLPLLIFLFGRVSLVSPIANVLVLVSVPYAMAFGFAAGALSFASSVLGNAVGAVAWLFLEYQIRTVHMLGLLPGAAVEVGTWLLYPLLLGYLFYVWYIWNRQRKT